MKTNVEFGSWKMPTKADLKARATTLKAWELEKQPSTFAPDGVWSNRDTDPLPMERRTWGFLTWFGYWCSDAVNVTTWQAAGTVIALGLSWREAIPTVFVGNTLVAVPIVLTGWIGAKHHIPFPVIARASFGYYFSYFAVLSRATLALFWFSVVSYSGSLAMQQMINAIWPSFRDLHNSLPAGAGITSQGLISYFLYWLMQFPFLMINPEKLGWFFLFKVITTPLVGLATMGWIVRQANGVGGLWNARPTVSGEQLTWLWIAAMNAAAAGNATIAVNSADFSRYARKPGYQWVQFPLVPVFSTIFAVLGLVSTNAAKVVYGRDDMWSPLAITDMWRSPGGRAAAFFASFCWTISQIGTNISCDTISAANDFTTLKPKYINIRRGVIFVSFIGGWALVPWKLVSAAAGFLNFLSAYAVFLAPISGIMVGDYWIVRRRQIDIPSLYRPHARYRYWKGINWRALLTMLIIVIPNLPGIAKAVNQGVNLPETSLKFYRLNFIWGCFGGCLIYSAFHFIVPAKETYISKTIETDDDASINDVTTVIVGVPADKGIGSDAASLEEGKKLAEV
ncbi:uncharacterized protein PV07_10670 [Cladophialophora immunda]|uniref:NCS1 nucleoside transporter n=1 Tax=Cladophialophora immunda TaxID=569365 RepID=A0A0D2CNA3_9EURO|nr:uncharacterized protein PV07_10670 [Cladophialophora immunda]KIW24994.1 hypothetical protein PV07_10670 [Cladophialophora immunda]OQV06643.1 hypothetical protein CLAIMM_11185 [Cladophialophora immunda]